VGVAALAQKATCIGAIQEATINQFYCNLSEVDKMELIILCAIWVGQ